MKELIEYVVKNLVEKPDAVEVREVKSEQATVYELIVDKGDMGRVIGKEGRIIKSMRTLVKAAAARTNDGGIVELEVIE